MTRPATAPDLAERVIGGLIDPEALELAGLRLELEASVFKLIADDPTAGERAFGEAEGDLEAARGRYRALLGQFTGLDVEAIERRLSA